MSEPTNLPANLEELDAHALAKLTGQKEDRTGNSLPTLRVNYDDQDGDGNDIPRGQWSCYLSDGRRVFAKKVSFRVFLTKYQYSHYNSDKQEFVSVSVYFDKFGDEAPDTAGGFKCNKVTRKQLADLTDAEKLIQKEIKASRVCFGLLSVEGVNPRGEPVSTENEPVMFYARGTNFMPMSDYIKTASASEGWLGAVKTKLSLKREKNGNVTYWTVVPETADTIKYGKDDLELLRMFYDTVEAENKEILEKHWEAQKKKDEPQEDASDQEVISPPFDDDIPENLRSALEAG